MSHFYSAAMKNAHIASATYKARDPAERAHYGKLRQRAGAHICKHPEVWVREREWLDGLNATRPADRFAYPEFKDWLRSQSVV